MDDTFKKNFQNLLTECGLNSENINFDAIHDFESFCDELGVTEKLLFGPFEFVRGLKFLFYIYQNKIDPATIHPDKMYSFDEYGSVIDESSLAEKLTEKIWAENVNIYAMGNPDLRQEENAEEDFNEAVFRNINFYQPFIKKTPVEDFAINISSLMNRLKLKLNFDLKEFDKEEYKTEVDKTLYFFFDLEYNRIPDFLNALEYNERQEDRTYFDAIEFLSNPSTESIDFSFLGWNTYNGKITRFIKYPLEQELGKEKVDHIRNALDSVMGIWQQRIRNLRRAVDAGVPIDFDIAIQEIQQLLNAPPKSYVTDSNSFSPIELLYLKVCQFEFIGELTDFIRVNQYAFRSTNYSVPPEYMGRMRTWKNKTIKFGQITQWMEQNIENIAKYTYLKEKPTAEERRQMKDNLWKIPLLLECCKRANPNVIVDDQVSILRVISCLQAILLDKTKDFSYIFYLMQEYFSHPRTDVLKKNSLKKDASGKDKHMVDAMQLFWVRKVNNHFNANLGEYEIRYKLEQYETKIYELLCKIYSCSSIPEMLAMHKSVSDDLFHPINGQ